MVTSIDIGNKRIWVTGYNPSDSLSELYVVYVLGRMTELLDQTPLSEVHAWLRNNVPDSAKFLDRIERGERPVRRVPAGKFPASPTDYKFEKPIIDFLLAKKRGRP